jgi:hypothetical protein
MSAVLPSEPASVLSRWERLWYAIAANRTKIGGLILALSGLVRIGLHFQGHSEVADTLKAIADLFVAGGLAGLTAGATHGDEHFEYQKQAVIRGRSGQFRAVKDPYEKLTKAEIGRF